MQHRCSRPGLELQRCWLSMRCKGARPVLSQKLSQQEFVGLRAQPLGQSHSLRSWWKVVQPCEAV